ncbi:MAG: extracellular solute-binding protein [Alphaproteobacteria bacterium]|nr:extracellular solute-binding protein [Alphaproteobacteria bacterium]
MTCSILSTARAFALAGAVAFGFSSAATASDPAVIEAAKKEGKLTVYTELPTEVIHGLITQFRKTYPTITVDFYRGSTTPLLQRFESEAAAGRHTVDVLTSSDQRSKPLVERGMFANYKSPELAKYEPGMQPDHGFFAIYTLNTTSFAWNPKVVPPGQEPKQWADLLDPKWKGKIGIQDPLTGGGTTAWIVTMYGHWGEAKWTDFMQRLAGQNLRYGTRQNVEEMVMSGELAMIAVDYPDFVEPLKAKGAPIEWGTPEPMMLSGLTIQLSAKAPNPNAGKLFIDFMLSKEGQETLGKLNTMPALKSEWPKAFDRLKSATLIPNRHAEIENQRYDFFQAKLKEFFGKRG